MIRFIQDYTTKSLPPEHFEKGQEVSTRSAESELYFVRLGVAGYVVDGVLVDQDYHPIVETQTVVVVDSADRRFRDGGRSGEMLGLDAPQRASTGPGNAVVFGTNDVDPDLSRVQVDQLTSDLAASLQQLDEHRTSTSEQIETLTSELTAAQGARESALSDVTAAEGERDAAIVERDEARQAVDEWSRRYADRQAELDAAVAKIQLLTEQLDAATAPAGDSAPTKRGK